MSIRLLTGDCRETLLTLPEKSVQCMVTSPPYYGLRDYGTPPLVWGGDNRPEHEHEWGNMRLQTISPQRDNSGGLVNNRIDSRGTQTWTAGVAATASQGQYCACGAWLGSHGLEPTPELYIQHEVEIFREVRRVLRDDGVLWLNLGDSYAGSGKGPTGHNGIGDQESRQGFNGSKPRAERSQNSRLTGGKTTVDVSLGGMGVPGYKPKDLLMIPFRVAMALQQDGWYLRSCIPWLKRNSMPESVTDRPSTSVEYVFLLAKSARYFWDADAVRMPNADPSRTNYRPGPEAYSEGNVHDASGRGRRNDGFQKYAEGASMNGRNRRNSDWFFESWQGLLADEDGEPLALVVNPQPFSGSHFATFPPRLVEPMIKASTSERGQCPECGAPWRRVSTSDGRMIVDRRVDHFESEPQISKGKSRPGNFYPQRTDSGWQPTCTCDAGEPVPQAILDCFGGAGTVGLVADRLGRNAVLCELKPDYASMATARVTDDAPLFAEVDSA